ncbi:MAG: glutathione S-transferase N-terminal domain-containing protein [Lautropia sp.]
MIELWELGGIDDRRYSNFAWRTRMALRHLGLEATLRPVALTDKAAIAFSGGTTVPVIRDGETVIRDSWAIAEYLESRHAGERSLFGGASGQALTRFVNGWVDRVVLAAAFPVVASDAIDVVVPADRDYFAGLIRKFTRLEPDALKQEQPKHIERLGRAVDPARAVLKRQPYLAGAEPGYADYALFSIYQWARIASPVDLLTGDAPLGAWFERLLDTHDGYARAAPARRR